MAWIDILLYISIWIIILPAIIGLILFRRLDKDSRIILVVVLIGCIPQIIKFFMDGTPLQHIVYNVYTPVEFIAYWILFRQKILTPSRKTILDGMAALFIFVSLYVIYSNDIRTAFIGAWVAMRNRKLPLANLVNLDKQARPDRTKPRVLTSYLLLSQDTHSTTIGSLSL